MSPTKTPVLSTALCVPRGRWERLDVGRTDVVDDLIIGLVIADDVLTGARVVPGRGRTGPSDGVGSYVAIRWDWHF